MLSCHEIERLIKEAKLIEVPEGEKIPSENIQPSSYDLRLGDEYVHGPGGVKSLLDKSDKSITIEPYDFVVVGSYEKVNLPSNIAARFQSRMRWAFKGLNMAMGAQVDPGYKGKLYCTLFNFTDEPITITYKEHLATIEFFETTYKEGCKVYAGQYQDRDDVLQTLFGGTYPKSGIKDLYDKMKEYDENLKKLGKGRFIISLSRGYGTITLIILAIITILVMIITELYPNETKAFISSLF